jgi:hypothetical protein
VERQKPGVVVLGLALVPEPEEQQGYKGGGRVESKSQLRGVWGFSFFLFSFL